MLPVHELVRMATFPIPDRVRQAVRRLIVNPMYIISPGVRGGDLGPNDGHLFSLRRIFWSQSASQATPPPLLGGERTRRGTYSIQAEITCRPNDATWRMSDAAVLEHTIAGLEQRQLVRREAIAFTDVRRSRYSYVVYDTDYEKNVKIVRDWFPRQGLHLVGRFSYFEYVNVDGAIERAMEIAGRLNGAPVSLPSS